MTPPETTGSSVAERAAANGHVAEDPQDGLFDAVIENDVLARALRKRQNAKEEMATKKKALEAAHDKVKGILSTLELGEEDLEVGDELVVRCGSFRIKWSRRKGNSVAFETSPSTQMRIKALD